jgi:hypothetical protein
MYEEGRQRAKIATPAERLLRSIGAEEVKLRITRTTRPTPIFSGRLPHQNSHYDRPASDLSQRVFLTASPFYLRKSCAFPSHSLTNSSGYAAGLKVDDKRFIV